MQEIVEPEVEVLKPDEMSDQEMMDLCDEEENKRLKLILGHIWLMKKKDKERNNGKS